MGVQWVALVVASGSWIGARYFDWLYAKKGVSCDPERFHRHKPHGPSRGTYERAPRSGNDLSPEEGKAGRFAYLASKLTLKGRAPARPFIASCLGPQRRRRGIKKA